MADLFLRACSREAMGSPKIWIGGSLIDVHDVISDVPLTAQNDA
jgi:hypothetical protein